MVGFLIGLLRDVTPDQCRDYINNNIPLFMNVSEDDWASVRELAQKINTDTLLKRDVIAKAFARRRSDLLGVILNHPNGLTWLDQQIAQARMELGLAD